MPDPALFLAFAAARARYVLGAALAMARTT